jgi:hypothetical protein
MIVSSPGFSGEQQEKLGRKQAHVSIQSETITYILVGGSFVVAGEPINGYR